MKPYEIDCEISGPTAMWTRPDTGDVPVSYPAPTYAAVKGIFLIDCLAEIRLPRGRHSISFYAHTHDSQSQPGDKWQALTPLATNDGPSGTRRRS